MADYKEPVLHCAPSMISPPHNATKTVERTLWVVESAMGRRALRHTHALLLLCSIAFA